MLEWLGFHCVQSWYCFVWSETRGVVETVIMTIEAIRKMLHFEPSPLVLHNSPSVVCMTHLYKVV